MMADKSGTFALFTFTSKAEDMGRRNSEGESEAEGVEPGAGVQVNSQHDVCLSAPRTGATGAWPGCSQAHMAALSSMEHDLRIVVHTGTASPVPERRLRTLGQS